MVLRYIVYMDSGYQRSCCQYGSLRQENQAGWQRCWTVRNQRKKSELPDERNCGTCLLFLISWVLKELQGCLCTTTIRMQRQTTGEVLSLSGAPGAGFLSNSGFRSGNPDYLKQSPTDESFAGSTEESKEYRCAEHYVIYCTTITYTTGQSEPIISRFITTEALHYRTGQMTGMGLYHGILSY